jgi:hypothetical protein
MTSPNHFEIVGETPFAEVEAQLRGITLLKQPDVHPYEDAEIFLQEFAWDEVVPTSKYVLSRQLAVQRAIRASIAPHGYDQLEMESGLIIVGGEKGQQGLIPPIVERFFEEDRPESVRPYIIDGSHRTNLGRMEGRNSFIGIFVAGIRPDCPPYAFPNTWEEVQEVAELPEDRAEWKKYRLPIGKEYTLYRDFSPLNGSTPRADNK